MNKKVIITIIAVVLIIALAIIVGKNIGQKDSTNTNANPTNEGIPTTDINSPTPDIELTPTPEETATPIATPKPTPNTNSTTNKNVATMSSKEKEEYAKEIAKETWEKLGASQKVYYSLGSITSDGKYQVAVRDSSTTAALVWYMVDINSKTCEVTY